MHSWRVYRSSHVWLGLRWDACKAALFVQRDVSVYAKIIDFVLIGCVAFLIFSLLLLNRHGKAKITNIG